MEKIKQNLEKFDGKGVWHEGGSPFYGITIKGMMTGCGIAQMSGVAYLSYGEGSNLTKETFLSGLAPFKRDGVGAIVCTLGYAYFHNEKRLLELGFKEISEYSNYRHSSSGSYKQRLYIIKL